MIINKLNLKNFRQISKRRADSKTGNQCDLRGE